MAVFRQILSAWLLLAACGVTAAEAEAWMRFRGPSGSGISHDDAPTAVTWNATQNLKWKTELPGPGSSCPIVVGDRVYVTSWSGYGLDREDPGDQNNLKRNLTCIDRETGDIVWSKAVAAVLPEDEYGGMFAEHGYASHTPVSDGEHIFVYFGKTGALAFDLEGNQLWQTGVGTESGPRGWGSASSPILYENLLIVTATAESEALVGLDKETGKEVWRQEAAGFNGVWGTPVLVEVDSDRTDLVIAVPNEIWGFNPENGKLRWYCEALGTNSFCSSVVAHDGIVYAIESGPGGGGGIAVRAGGDGDVSQSHVVWSGRQSNRIGTPIVYEDRIYAFSNKTLNCIDAKSGEEIFRSRLKATSAARGSQRGEQGQRGERSRGRGRRGGRGGMGGQDYSSPVLADGKIYFTTRSGDMHVVEAGREFNQLAVNRATDEREDFSATPAVSDGQLLIRSSKYLYCVAGDDDVQANAIGAGQQSVAATSSDAARQQDPAAPPPAGRRGGGEFDPAAIFARRDADGNGRLTGDELSGPLADNLKQIDTDQDNAVTLEEFQSGIRQLMRGGRGGYGRDPRAGRPERQQRPSSD